MSLHLYDTGTRSIRPFEPLEEGRVGMYVCGATPQASPHIGHLRSGIIYDLLLRWLRRSGYDVAFVRNVTDVDDKIIAVAAERGVPWFAVAEGNQRVFGRGYELLGCLPPTIEPRATGHVPEMIVLIRRLIEAGHAYTAGGDVYFDVRSWAEHYGALSNQKLENMLSAGDTPNEDCKRDPRDFALWKGAKPGEPFWETPWGDGRPGWHLECSAMATKYLGATFDIHGGGVDLIFPHHENEIAQSCCAFGTERMANYWMHNGFLQVEGRKMAKSEGNFVTINELLNTEKFGGRKWPGEVLRLAMLMTHYREPIDFSINKLENAQNLLTRWYRLLAEIWPVQPSQPRKQFLEALSDDLNTAKALEELYTMFSSDQAGLLEVGASELGWDFYEPECAAMALASARLLGLLTDSPSEWLQSGVELSSEDIFSRISTRLAFIRDKNWAEADKIRDELLAQGIQLKDGKDPATGERITTWEVKR